MSVRLKDSISGPLSGNANTASTLRTARSINGTNFNGSANITTANWGTARTLTIGSTGKSVNGSGNVSWSLAEIGAAAASHSHSNMITLKSNHVSDWTGASSMSGKTYMGGWHGNLTSGTTGYISLAANGSNSLDLIIDGELYVKENNKVYHAGNKPNSIVTSNGGGVYEGNGDNASSTQANVQIKSWYGIGFGPSISGQTVPQNQNAVWINVRNGSFSARGTMWAGGNIQSDTYMSSPTLVTNRIQGRTAANRAYMGSGSCRFDTNGNYFRVFTSAVGANDCGLRVDPSGGLSIMVNSVGKHALNSDGSKYGGSIEIEGITYGMSPIDSPKFLIEDILFNVEVEESGTIINLNNIFAKSINGEYAVFVNNNKAEISDKQFDNFKVSGYTGKVDIRIVGKRIEYENEYFKIMGGFEHGTEQEISN